MKNSSVLQLYGKRKKRKESLIKSGKRYQDEALKRQLVALKEENKMLRVNFRREQLGRKEEAKTVSNLLKVGPVGHGDTEARTRALQSQLVANLARQVKQLTKALKKKAGERLQQAAESTTLLELQLENDSYFQEIESGRKRHCELSSEIAVKVAALAKAKKRLIASSEHISSLLAENKSQARKLSSCNSKLRSCVSQQMAWKKWITDLMTSCKAPGFVPLLPGEKVLLRLAPQRRELAVVVDIAPSAICGSGSDSKTWDVLARLTSNGKRCEAAISAVDRVSGPPCRPEIVKKRFSLGQAKPAPKKKLPARTPAAPSTPKQAVSAPKLSRKLHVKTATRRPKRPSRLKLKKLPKPKRRKVHTSRPQSSLQKRPVVQIQRPLTARDRPHTPLNAPDVVVPVNATSSVLRSTNARPASARPSTSRMTLRMKERRSPDEFLRRKSSSESTASGSHVGGFDDVEPLKNGKGWEENYDDDSYSQTGSAEEQMPESWGFGNGQNAKASDRWHSQKENSSSSSEDEAVSEGEPAMAPNVSEEIEAENPPLVPNPEHEVADAVSPSTTFEEEAVSEGEPALAPNVSEEIEAENPPPVPNPEHEVADAVSPSTTFEEEAVSEGEPALAPNVSEEIEAENPAQATPLEQSSSTSSEEDRRREQEFDQLLDEVLGSSLGKTQEEDDAAYVLSAVGTPPRESGEDEYFDSPEERQAWMDGDTSVVIAATPVTGRSLVTSKDSSTTPSTGSSSSSSSSSDDDEYSDDFEL